MSILDNSSPFNSDVNKNKSQHNTRPGRPKPRPQRARPRPIFLVSDRSCPKTDGLRPHHCHASYPFYSDAVRILHHIFAISSNAQNSPFPQIFSTSLLVAFSNYSLLDRTDSAQRFYFLVIFLSYFLFGVVR